MAEVPPKIVELCLLVGAVVRSSAVWGADREKGADDELSMASMISCVDELLKFALNRPPIDEEKALIFGG